MNRCYLSLGSNQGSPERQIRRAINSIKALPSTSIIKTASFYWTKAWGLEAQQNFCNTIVAINTLLTPHLLLNQCKLIETQQGRVRKKRWGPRIIDIDIILYAKRKIKTPDLIIPHPHMHSREFVLKPLLELLRTLS